VQPDPWQRKTLMPAPCGKATLERERQQFRLLQDAQAAAGQLIPQP